MEITVKKWGNSLGIRIPSSIAKQFNISDGSNLKLMTKNNEIILKMIKKKYNLEALLSKITDDNKHDETDASSPQGNEVW